MDIVLAIEFVVIVGALALLFAALAYIAEWREKQDEKRARAAERRQLRQHTWERIEELKYK